MKRLTISFFDHFVDFLPASHPAASTPRPGTVVLSDSNLDSVFLTLQQKVDVLVIYSHGFRRIVEYLISHFQFVKAAGGVVSDPKDHRLLIYREGNWDIPKGMVEPGESLAQAAVREVQEETGISDITLDNLIVKTYHIYDKYGGWHLKQTSWFRMHTPQQQSTIPQTSEGITHAEWVSESQCRTLLHNSFASLQIVCQKL